MSDDISDAIAVVAAIARSHAYPQPQDEDADLHWSEPLSYPDSADVAPASSSSQGGNTEQKKKIADPYRWFITTKNNAHAWRVTEGYVNFAIGGKTTYALMASILGGVTSGGFISLVGWTLYLDFEFASGKNFFGYLKDICAQVSKGNKRPDLPVRVLVWQNMTEINVNDTHDQNRAEIDRINHLLKTSGWSTEAARLDAKLAWPLPDGVKLSLLPAPSVQPLDSRFPGYELRHSYDLGLNSRHQKIIVVHRGAGNGLVGFCGGVDINPDRTNEFGTTFDRVALLEGGVEESRKLTVTQAGAPDHDVHLQIIGPAAYDLLRISVARWYGSASATQGASDSFVTRVRRSAGTPPPQRGPHLIQVGQTARKGHPYKAERSTARSMFLRAISIATQYIYIEDQYMWSKDAAEAISKALLDKHRPNLKVVILIPPSEYTEPWAENPVRDGDVSYQLRSNFYSILLGPAKQNADRVRVCHLRHTTSKKDRGTYIHSKTWIFDDEYFICGSANCNNRGWGKGGYADNEVVAGVATLSGESKARQLRIALWRRHLGPGNYDNFSLDVWNEGQGSGDFRVKAFVPKWTAETPVSPWAWAVDPPGW